MDVYILNMPERQERRESVMKTFMGKNCFTLHIVTPISHPIPRVSQIGANSLFRYLCKRLINFYNKGL